MPRFLSAIAFVIFTGALSACLYVDGKRVPAEEPPAAAAAPANSLGALRAEIAARFDDPRFAHAFWGAYIESLDTGEIWYERNADRLFLPASNEKIPTTAATLMTLGPDFTFETALCRRGEIREGALEGDLIVFGDGDPTLYERFFADSREVFRRWAAALREQGVERVTGDIIGDDNAFDDQRLGAGWSYDYLDTWYAAEFGALQLNENYIDVKIIPPADASGAVTLEPNLPSAYYTLVNQIRVAAEGSSSVRVSRDFGSNEIVFSGRVKAGDKPWTVSPTITNPTLFYVTVLRETLEAEGIRVEGRAVDCDDLPGWSARREDFPRVATHHSPPLAEILTGLMKRSQNLYAETMPRLLGYKETGLGSFANGRKVVEARLAELGVAPGTYEYSDGSGLGRYNYVSPRQLATILRGMDRHAYGEVWRNTFPIAGVDGTLRSRMKGTPAEGNVRAKTGTIANVRGLSGYVTTADGERLLFSFLVNASLRSNRENEEITDGVCALLAGFKRQ